MSIISNIKQFTSSISMGKISIPIRCYSDGAVWLRRQNKFSSNFYDPYVRLARDHSFRARSAFKLIELDEKFHLLHPGARVVDLGAAPGAWTQVLVQKCNSLGQLADRPVGFVLAVDLLPMVPLDGATFLSQADVTVPQTASLLAFHLNSCPLNVLVSDMAPNPTGDSSTDHSRIVRLCRIALDLVVSTGHIRLVKGGSFVCKMWDGSERRQFVNDVGGYFGKVNAVKPPASREHSAELYIVARDFRGHH